MSRMRLTPTDLRILLLRRGRSVASIARQLGITREQVSQVLRGVRTTAYIRQAIADAVDLSYSTVWGEEASSGPIPPASAVKRRSASQEPPCAA